MPIFNASWFRLEDRWSNLTGSRLSQCKLLAWSLVALGLVGGIVGQLSGWFITSRFYDEALHAFTAAALAAALGLHLYPRKVNFRHPLGSIAVIAAVVLGIGAVWEVAEWIADQYWAPIIRSDRDTMLDLIADVAGASLGAAVAVHIQRRLGAGSRESRSRDNRLGPTSTAQTAS